MRIPQHNVVQALLEELGEPFMSSSLELPGVEMYELDSQDVEDKIGHAVELIIDSGYTPIEPSTVVELLDNGPQIIREGKGVIDFV
ncbi:MAG: Sua5/YciO/YrdC/YwlC family protein [Alcanivoracaceae bacterium]|nr:Sua5/YciO/YrdC/YwlC family protein [Alcanivoracaceae bacterium]